VKRFAISIAILQSFLINAQAQELDKMEVAFLAKSVGAAYVVNHCEGRFEMDYPGALRWGNSNGVDVQHLVAAAIAAQNSGNGEDYNPADIDPRVTRALHSIDDALEAMQRDDKARLCKDLGELSVREGFLKKKTGL
jgi:hypothetical protein